MIVDKMKKNPSVNAFLSVALGALLLVGPSIAFAAPAISQAGDYNTYSLPATGTILPGNYDDRGTPDCGTSCASQYGKNAVYCGIYAPDVDNVGNPKANTPYVCQLTPGVLSAGVSIPNNGVPGQGWVIDTATTGSMDQPLPCGQSGIVTGVSKYGKDSGTSGGNQIDSGFCQNIAVPSGVTFDTAFAGTYDVLGPLPSVRFCPLNMLMSGGLNAAGKNDSWDGFMCSPLNVPIPDSIGATRVSDNLPSVMNAGQPITTGVDGRPLNVVMRNVGWDTWLLNTFHYVGIQGSSQYCLVDTNGDGFPDSPSVGTTVTQTDGGTHDVGYSPAGSSCTVIYTAGSSDLQLLHAASQFGANPASASPMSPAFTVTNTITVFPRVCSGSGQMGGRQCNGPYANDVVSGNGNIWSRVFSASTIAQGNLYGQAIPPTAPTQTTFSLGTLTAPLTPGTYTETWSLAYPAPGFSFSNLGGSFSKKITVIGATGATAVISANPLSITLGQPTALSWSSSNVTACTAASTQNDWTGSVGLSGANVSVTPTAAGSDTYTITCTPSSGAPVLNQITVNVVSPSSAGNINVNSVSSAVWIPSGTMPNLPPYPDKGGEVDGPAGTVMCGLHSAGYAMDLFGLQGPVMADVPIYCPLTNAAIAAGVAVTRGVYQTDSNVNGGSMYCNPANNGVFSPNSGDVIVGAEWAKNDQLDFGFCGHLTIGGRAVNLVLNATPVAPAIYQSAYCPVDSVMVGGQNATGKNDSWGAFYCAKVQMGSASGDFPITAYKSIPSSWSFNESKPADNPCALLGAICSPQKAAAYVYQGAIPDTYTISPDALSAGSNYVLKGVEEIAVAEKPSFFAELKNWLVGIARAFTVYDQNGNPAQSQTLISGAAITFVIDWAPTITPPPIQVSSVKPTCSPATISVNQTANCTATVSGTGPVSQGVTWTIDPGGIGSINSLGVYTAPSSLVNITTVKIRATSQEDPTVSQTFTISVDPPVGCSPASQWTNISGNNGASGTTNVNATLTGTGGNGTYAWDASNGSGVPSSGSTNPFVVNYATKSPAPGYQVIVTSGTGNQASCRVHVIDLSCTISADTTKVIIPSAVKISWNCTNPPPPSTNTCTLSDDQGNNFGTVPLSGSKSIIPSANNPIVSYQLTCTGGPGGGPTNTVTYKTPGLKIQVVKPSVREP